MCQSLDDAQKGNDRLQNLADTKTLEFHLDKSCVVILGSKKAKEKMEEEFRSKPLTLYNQPIKVVEQESYLGDELGSSVADSIGLTIKKRLGIAKKAIFEIKQVVEDCRSEVVGGIRTGLMLWEACVLPYVLYNSSTWLKIRQKDIDSLNQLQNLFLNHLLKVQHCPSLMMLWDLGLIPMHFRILKEKLLLYHH